MPEDKSGAVGADPHNESARATPEHRDQGGSFTPPVVDYFKRHAIDPAVAARAGVLDRSGRLIFTYSDAEGPYERTRAIGGTTLQPAGRALSCWWPDGRPARPERVIVCEGESDALAVLTATERADDPFAQDILGALAVIAVPGASFPADRLAGELRGAELVILAPDADQAGDSFADGAAEALQKAEIASVRLRPHEGNDLADQLAADGPDWLAHALADLMAAAQEPGEPIETARLLGEVTQFLRRFVILPSDAAATAVALFVLHTYAIDAAEQTPYLLVTSPERQSGKTRLLEVLELLVRTPWRVAGASEAALFRKIEQTSPTLLLDEVDAIFGSTSERVEPLRCLLNAGNRRGACVSRVVGKGKDMEVADFAVYGAKMLAGIATLKLPDTLTDRSLPIEMQRRRPGEQVDRLRWRHANRDAEPIRTALERWATDAIEALQDAEPGSPEDLSDRKADAWEPLLAIADHAGGEWPVQSRSAALELSAPREGYEVGHGAQLLAATKAVMQGREAIRTEDLLRAINAEEELPFGGWRDGKGLDARGLARLLRPYGVRPRTVRVGQTLAKGYAAGDFRDAFSRYLSEPTHATRATQGHSVSADNPSKHGDVSDVSDVSANPDPVGDVSDAANKPLPDGAGVPDMI